MSKQPGRNHRLVDVVLGDEDTRIDVYKRQIVRYPADAGRVPLQDNPRNPYIFGHAAVHIPVSYTHLDVYKRQGQR